VFTGLISEIGRIQSLRKTAGGLILEIMAPGTAAGLTEHDSVSCNGVCLTVTSSRGESFLVEAVEETLKKTTLGKMKKGSALNLELALRLGDRMGGHIVQGHIDCVGRISAIERRASSWLIDVAYPARFSKYLIPVGSIAVDGISLTVASVARRTFTVSIIPYTWGQTTLQKAVKGQDVNLEFDLIGKYVENMVATGGEQGLTECRLREWGY
jgi:riboflavin synthase